MSITLRLVLLIKTNSAGALLPFSLCYVYMFCHLSLYISIYLKIDHLHHQQQELTRTIIFIAVLHRSIRNRDPATVPRLGQACKLLLLLFIILMVINF